jgi:uncharacterized coiled-coil protein SlyX
MSQKDETSVEARLRALEIARAGQDARIAAKFAEQDVKLAAQAAVQAEFGERLRRVEEEIADIRRGTGVQVERKLASVCAALGCKLSGMSASMLAGATPGGHWDGPAATAADDASDSEVEF